VLLLLLLLLLLPRHCVVWWCFVQSPSTSHHARLCSHRLLGEAAAGVDGDTSAVLLCNRLESGAVASIAGRPAAAEAPSRAEQLMLVLQPGAAAAVYEVGCQEAAADSVRVDIGFQVESAMLEL
jgi:hypothetical protein